MRAAIDPKINTAEIETETTLSASLAFCTLWFWSATMVSSLSLRLS